jgi:hypothetical protein
MSPVMAARWYLSLLIAASFSCSGSKNDGGNDAAGMPEARAVSDRTSLGEGLYDATTGSRDAPFDASTWESLPPDGPGPEAAALDSSLLDVGPPMWSVVTSPNQGSNNNNLASVSCVSPSFCVAAGDYLDAAGVHQTLVEAWNGTGWSIVPSPNQGTSDNYLNSVACTSTTNCTAVGESYADGTSPGQTLVLSWDGTAWSPVPSPNQGTFGSFLYSVACNSKSDCTTAGAYQTSSGSFQTLIETWDGATWSIVASASPPSYDNLWSVACPVTGSCVVVGGYSPPAAPNALTLIETGPPWNVVASPNPGTGSNDLVPVSCAATASCTAVGNYQPMTLSGDQTLIEAWNGSSWSVVSSPNPTTVSDLRGVSCPSTNSCTAAGYSLDASSTEHTLVEVWDGSTWSIRPSPDPGLAARLESVACPTSTWCMAVGRYASSTILTQTLAEILR